VVHAVVTGIALPTEDGDELILCQVEDVTARRETDAELRRMAQHDVLTDLPGRSLLLERLTAAVSSRRREDALVAVLFIDLDGLKQLNDARGHAAGDVLLRQAAARLRATVRPHDVVGRFGGDEFLVIATGLDDEQEARALAARIESTLRLPVSLGDDEVPASASIGLALCPVEGSDPEQLIADADTAMYLAKRNGRRRYELFDESMRERARAGERLQSVLAGAVAERRVEVHYQPIVALGSGRVVAVEALMRVRTPDGTLLHPESFLETAESSGLLRASTSWSCTPRCGRCARGSGRSASTSRSP